jgi:effector-binding domain-containing protein
MLKIHGLPFSAHTRKVIVAALEKQIPYELIRVVPLMPPPRWRELSPLGLIPAIEDGEDDQIDVEIGFVQDGEMQKPIVLPDGRKLLERELPAERIAACVRVGLPEQAHLITGKIAQFIAANRYRLAGPSREVFLQWPNLQRMDESIVEMQYPIAAVSEAANTE